MVPLYPAEDLYPEEGATCECCDRPLVGETLVVVGEDLCESCANEEAAEIEKEAIEFAKENCQIAHTLPKFDKDNQYRCTPEEYASGMRESNTPYSHSCLCRHEYTNYDILISQLDKSDWRDRIFYRAIRERIEELLADADYGGETDWDEDDVEGDEE